MQLRRARFGAFEVDLSTGELRKHGMRIRLQGQPFQVLQLLLEHRGEMVSREQLCSRLWPDNSFVDFDVGLNTAVKRLREALGDSAENSRYIETLPRKGYRFIAAVEPIEAPAAPLEVISDQSEGVSSQSEVPIGRPRRWKRWSIAGSTVVVASLLLYLNADELRQRFHLRPTTIHSIAVLPLDNLSGDPAQEYFADGLTDALTAELGQIGHLRVVSRTSTMHYKGANKSLQEIARELQVDGVIEGSVERSGDRVRVTASLVQAVPEKQLWADTFESNIRNVLDLQDNASRAIAHAIQIKLSAEEQARLTSSHPANPQAYDSYLQGRFFAQKYFPYDGSKSIEYFEAAIRGDPTWALPHVALAEVYLVECINLAIPNEKCTKVKNEALEALKRDPESPEARAVLADVTFFCEWNWVSAERDVAHAIAVNPNFAVAHAYRGRYLLTMGRKEESLRETAQAVELDPLAIPIRWDRWLTLYMAGRYSDAFEQCQKMQELDPNLDFGYLCGADVYVQTGDLARAIELYEKAANVAAGKNPRVIAHLAYAYALAGRRNDAQKLVDHLIDLSRQRHVHPALIALVYVGLGRREAAFEWLERAYQVRGRDLLDIRDDPQFAALHTDPRFKDLLRRIGLAPL